MTFIAILEIIALAVITIVGVVLGIGVVLLIFSLIADYFRGKF